MARIKHETRKLTRLAHAWKPEASSFVDKMFAPVLPVNWPGTNFELAQADICNENNRDQFLMMFHGVFFFPMWHIHLFGFCTLVWSLQNPLDSLEVFALRSVALLWLMSHPSLLSQFCQQKCCQVVVDQEAQLLVLALVLALVQSEQRNWAEAIRALANISTWNSHNLFNK